MTLPLAFLLATGLGITELTVVYLLRGIHCDAYKATQPHPPTDVDVCRLPSVQRAYSRDATIYSMIVTILNILCSGPYGQLSDTKGRRYALAVAASLTAAGDAWLGATGWLVVPVRVCSHKALVSFFYSSKHRATASMVCTDFCRPERHRRQPTYHERRAICHDCRHLVHVRSFVLHRTGLDHVLDWLGHISSRWRSPHGA